MSTPDSPNNGASGLPDPGIDAGGAASIPPNPPPATTLDMRSEKDRGHLRRAITRNPGRWAGVDERKKQKWLQQLEDAGDTAHALMKSATQPTITDDGDPTVKVDKPAMALEAARVIVSVVRTGALMERQNQIDELVREKYDRLDEGKPTDRTEHLHGLTLAAIIQAEPALAPALEAAVAKAQQSARVVSALPGSA